MLVSGFWRRAIIFFNRLKKGAALNIMINTVKSLGLGFASYYFLTQGLEFYKIVLVWAIIPLAALPVVYFINDWDTKKFLRIGVAAYAGAALSLLFYMPYSYILFGIFNGLASGLFWVSFNTAFFNKSKNSQHAKDASMYFIFPSLAGIVMPPLGALVIDSFGYKILFLVTLLICIAPFLYIQGKYFDYKATMSFKKVSKQFHGIRLIASMDASLHFFQWHFLTIYALLFLNTEYEFGGLLSYLALISLVVSFALSYASDRFNKRVEILFPLLIVMAVLILIIPSLHSLAALVPIIGLYTVLDKLSLPIRYAVPVDMGTKDIGFWRASEFYGSVGRGATFAISALLLFIGNYWLPFILFAAIAGAYPFVVNYKLKHRKLATIDVG